MTSLSSSQTVIHELRRTTPSSGLRPAHVREYDVRCRNVEDFLSQAGSPIELSETAVGVRHGGAAHRGHDCSAERTLAHGPMVQPTRAAHLRAHARPGAQPQPSSPLTEARLSGGENAIGRVLSPRLLLVLDRDRARGAVYRPCPGRAASVGRPALHCCYGAVVNAQMSELPNVPGHACWTGGAVAAVPFWRACRYASIAGQSAAFRVSFHTAAP